MDDFRPFSWWLFAPYKEYFIIFLIAFSFCFHGVCNPACEEKASLPLRSTVPSCRHSNLWSHALVSSHDHRRALQQELSRRRRKKKRDPWLTAQLWPWSPHLQPVSTSWVWSTSVQSLRSRAVVHYFTIYQWRTVNFSGLVSLRKWGEKNI